MVSMVLGLMYWILDTETSFSLPLAKEAHFGTNHILPTQPTSWVYLFIKCRDHVHLTFRVTLVGVQL